MFSNTNLKKELSRFLKIYYQRPIKNNYSGMRIEHCFALYCFLKRIKPKAIIESGVWKGQTTWLIKKILPKVKLYSIDLDLSNRKIVYEDVKYLDKDISKYSWDGVDKNKCLIIFDDHVCFSKRINFILNNKFKHIVFDDNLPNNFIGYYTPKMIIEKQNLITQQFIKITNLKRLTMFIFMFFFIKKFKLNNYIYFKNKYIHIIKKNKFKTKHSNLFKKFKKKISIYYEFPPILKFNPLIRFKKFYSSFDFDKKKYKYKVKNPIFKDTQKIKLDKDVMEEISAQYGNICYLKIKY